MASSLAVFSCEKKSDKASISSVPASTITDSSTPPVDTSEAQADSAKENIAPRINLELFNKIIAELKILFEASLSRVVCTKEGVDGLKLLEVSPDGIDSGLEAVLVIDGTRYTIRSDELTKVYEDLFERDKSKKFFRGDFEIWTSKNKPGKAYERRRKGYILNEDGKMIAFRGGFRYRIPEDSDPYYSLIFMRLKQKYFEEWQNDCDATLAKFGEFFEISSSQPAPKN